MNGKKHHFNSIEIIYNADMHRAQQENQQNKKLHASVEGI